MLTVTTRVFGAVILCGSLAAAMPTPALAGDRSPAALRKEIDVSTLPEADLAISRNLGIDSIPTVFLVDQKGKLFSLDAGGKLERLILELMQTETQ